MALVETAIIAGPFFILIFGILEFGLLLKDFLSIDYTTQVGARQAAIQGSASDADFFILQSINNQGSALPRGSISKIVIYNASIDNGGVVGTDGGEPTPACQNATPNSGGSHGSGANNIGACNVYDAQIFGADQSAFNCTNGFGNFWCGTERKSWIEPSGGRYEGPDYIGVWIEYKFYYITGLFGDEITLTNNTIYQIDSSGWDEL